MDMIEKREWKEFQNSGLLWWVNRTLHLFGWAICLVQEEDGAVIDAYPAKCKFRGFETDSEEEGFERVTMHIKDNINEWEKDVLIEEGQE
jgi:hypothetical protein